MDNLLQLVPVAFGAGITWVGSLFTGRLEAKRETRAWEREQAAERQRNAEGRRGQFEARLTVLIVKFEEWAPPAEEQVQNMAEPWTGTPNPEFDFDEHASLAVEVGRLLSELEVISYDADILDAVQAVSRARKELLRLEDLHHEMKLPNKAPLIQAWKAFVDAMDQLKSAHVRRRVSEGS